MDEPIQNQQNKTDEHMAKADKLLKDMQASKKKFADDTGKTVSVLRADADILADVRTNMLKDLGALDEDTAVKADEELLAYIEELDDDGNDFGGLSK